MRGRLADEPDVRTWRRASTRTTSRVPCSHANVISGQAPQLHGSQPDEVGLAAVNYEPLDPDRFKSGCYEYSFTKDGSILQMDIDQLPDPGTGLPAPGTGPM